VWNGEFSWTRCTKYPGNARETRLLSSEGEGNSHIPKRGFGNGDERGGPGNGVAIRGSTKKFALQSWKEGGLPIALLNDLEAGEETHARAGLGITLHQVWSRRLDDAWGKRDPSGRKRGGLKRGRESIEIKTRQTVQIEGEKGKQYLIL